MKKLPWVKNGKWFRWWCANQWRYGKLDNTNRFSVSDRSRDHLEGSSNCSLRCCLWGWKNRREVSREQLQRLKERRYGETDATARFLSSNRSKNHIGRGSDCRWEHSVARKHYGPIGFRWRVWRSQRNQTRYGKTEDAVQLVAWNKLNYRPVRRTDCDWKAVDSQHMVLLSATSMWILVCAVWYVPYELIEPVCVIQFMFYLK